MSHDRPQKITLAEMRAANVRGLLIYCSDYRCSHWTAISADRWPDDVRLSDLEPVVYLRFAAGVARMCGRSICLTRVGAAAQLPLRLKISGPYGAGYADVPAGQKRAFTSRAMAFENLPEAGAAARNWKYDIRAITADLGGG